MTEPSQRSQEKKRALLKRLLRKKAQQEEAPLSFGQERIWFLDQLAPANAAYCETVAIRLAAEVNPQDLTRAPQVVTRALNDGFSRARVSCDQGETAFAHEVFKPEGERVDARRYKQGFWGNIGEKGVPLEPVEGVKRTTARPRSWSSPTCSKVSSSR